MTGLTDRSQPHSLDNLRRRFKRLEDRRGDSFPVCGLRFEMSPPGPRELVIFGLATVLRLAPFGYKPALLGEAMKRRKQRARFGVKCSPGDLVDSVCDPQPVIGTKTERLEDQSIDCALQ